MSNVATKAKKPNLSVKSVLNWILDHAMIIVIVLLALYVQTQRDAFLNLRLGQGRGRLVQHNNLGVEGNSFCNFHHLTARNGHGGHDGTRVDVDAEFLKIQILKDLHGHVVFGLVGNEGHLSAAELDSRIAPEPNVVHHATLQRLIQLLMHHGRKRRR